MHVHLPKPFHDWREFVGEVMIIVLGVGIALGAEQLIEAAHWRHQLAEAKTAITSELRDDDLPQAMTRIALAPCLARDLDQLQAAVEDGRDRARIAQLIRSYQPPSKSWDNQAWQTALASGAAAHSGPKALMDFGGSYDQIPHLQQWNDAEHAVVNELGVARRDGVPLSSSEQERLLELIRRLKAFNADMDRVSGHFERGLSDNGIVPPPNVSSAIVAEIGRYYQGCAANPLRRQSYTQLERGVPATPPSPSTNTAVSAY